MHAGCFLIKWIGVIAWQCDFNWSIDCINVHRLQQQQQHTSLIELDLLSLSVRVGELDNFLCIELNDN